jgi:hypothetical protein
VTAERREAAEELVPPPPAPASARKRKNGGAEGKASAPLGTSQASVSEPVLSASDALPLDRAETMLDQMGQRVGQLLLLAGHRLQRWTARAREEAEDIWAEAASLRARQR